jgi:hypothetical protein
VVVARIAGLEISRHALGVDPRQILFEKRHAEATPSMHVPGAQETQVVVRFVSRVCFIKAAEQLCDLGSARTHERF